MPRKRTSIPTILTKHASSLHVPGHISHECPRMFIVWL